MTQDGVKIDNKVSWQKITLAGTITGGATAKHFLTGDWRAERPVFLPDKCRQCLLCAPVCPDTSIPVSDRSRIDFDYGHCKGCGICAEVCPFGAIVMEKEI